MRKCFKSLCSLLIITSIVANDITPINAEKEVEVKTKEDLVLDIVGTEELNTDIVSDNDNILVADGYEMCIKIPKESSEPIYFTDGICEEIEMNLPQEASRMDGKLSDKGTVLYTSKGADVSFDIEPLQYVGKDEETLEGLRTSIIIDNENAPHEYEFSYELDAEDKLVSSAEYLGEDFDTGEYYVVDRENEIKYIIDAPWAKDANGNSINTYYRREGNKLIQNVEFDKNTAFPVVADPSFWKVAKCVASVAWLIASSYLAASKIKDIKKYIKELGGIREAVVLIIGTSNADEVKTKVATTVLSLISAFFGVDRIINNCPGIKTTYKKLKKKFG